MAYKKILGFLLFLSPQILAAPWYVFADNDEVDKLYEDKIIIDHDTVSNKLYTAAVAMERLIQPIAEDNLDKIHDNQRTAELFLALLIKANDFGSKKAKVKLKHVLTNGLYGVDKDDSFAQKLYKELAFDRSYVEPKPWYEIFDNKKFVPQILEYDIFADKEKRAQLIFDYAEFLLSILPTRNSRSYEEKFVFFLARASSLGSIKAKRWLAKILHEGSYGVKRDNEMAKNLEAEVAISELSGFEKMLADDYASVKEFHYNHVRRVLEVYHCQGLTYYYGSEAENLNKAFSYLEKKHQAQACADLLTNSDLELRDLESLELLDLESVD